MQTDLKSYSLALEQRKTICESIYIDCLGTTVRLLIGLPEDLSIILDYTLSVHFNGNLDSFQKSIDKSLLEIALKNSLVILATDCFEICGVIGATYNFEPLKVKKLNLDSHLVVNLFEISENYGGALHKRMLKEMLKYTNWVNYERVLIKCQNEQIKNAALQLGIKVDSNDILIANLAEINKFIFDNTPSLPQAYELKNKTRKLMDTIFIKKLNREIRFEIALFSDIPVVKHYMLNEFMKQTPLTKTLQRIKTKSSEYSTFIANSLINCNFKNFHAEFSKQTVMELFEHRFDPKLFESELVTVALDQNRICGVCTFNPIQITSRSTFSTKVPNDFEKEVLELNSGESLASQIHAVALWIMKFVPQFLPLECTQYIRQEMLNVHPDYMNYGIGRNFGKCNLEQLLKKGYKYLQFLNVAASSNTMLTNTGATTLISVPFTDFKYKGKPIFPYKSLCDGGTEMKLIVLDFESYKKSKL